MTRKYWIETYGCEMNKAESAAIEAILRAAGFTSAAHPREADSVILNTCSVRNTAENRIWGRIGFYGGLKKHRRFRLVVTGCMAEHRKVALLEYGIVDDVVGTRDKTSLPFMLIRAADGETVIEKPNHSEYRFFASHLGNDPHKAFVPIMNGCDNFCSYCIVPYVRGREVSRPFSSILDEIDNLDRRGIKEITLLGQNVNSYTDRQGGKLRDFADLLAAVAARVDAIRWIRFISSHPKDFTERIASVMASSSRFCRYLHLPVQNGSDRILHEMNRRYTASQYIDLVGMIRSYLPGIALSTDILVGFPGETEKDVEATISLMESVRFSEAYTYYYNPIDGTPASLRTDSVPEEEKLERLSRVITIQQRITREEKIKRLGTVPEVFAERISKRSEAEILGRTPQNDMAVFPGDPSLIGSFLRIRLKSLSGNTFYGEVQA